MIEHLQPPFPEATTEGAEGCRVVGLDTDDADLVFSALASETRRSIFAEVCQGPGTPTNLADRAGTSLQNSLYHLDKLEVAGLVEVVYTRYSPKGRYMDVYAPTSEPLAIVMGDESDLGELEDGLTDQLAERPVSDEQGTVPAPDNRQQA